MTLMFRSLSSPMYRIWFFAALCSNLGTWMQATAQTWLVLDELSHGSAVAVGITIGLQLGPQLLLAPWAGVLADRVSQRRYILIVTQAAMLILGTALGVLVLTGHAALWQLLLFALAFGTVNAVDAPSRQALVGDLVVQDDLTNAVALNSAIWNTARLIGPALAGVLIALIGTGWVFIVNGATFMLVITALLVMRTVQPHIRAERVGLRAEVMQGLRHVAAKPDLCSVFVIAFVMGGWGMNSPIFTSTMSLEYGRGAAGYGFLSSIFAVGAILAALLAARRPIAELSTIAAAAGGYGLFSVVAALMPSYEAYAAVTILTGFTIVTTMITCNSFVQQSVGSALRGRVMGFYMATSMGGAPLGALSAGWAADKLGARWSVGVGAAAGFACLTVALTALASVRRPAVASAQLPVAESPGRPVPDGGV